MFSRGCNKTLIMCLCVILLFASSFSFVFAEEIEVVENHPSDLEVEFVETFSSAYSSVSSTGDYDYQMLQKLTDIYNKLNSCNTSVTNIYNTILAMKTSLGTTNTHLSNIFNYCKTFYDQLEAIDTHMGSYLGVNGSLYQLIVSVFHESVNIFEATQANGVKLDTLNQMFSAYSSAFGVEGPDSFDYLRFDVYDGSDRPVSLPVRNLSGALRLLNNNLIGIALNMEGSENVSQNVDSSSVTSQLNSEKEVVGSKVDSSDLVIDISGSSYSGIFGWVNDFVQINGKVFALFLAVLTLSFVQFVLSRRS